jgi:hypothetical protein
VSVTPCEGGIEGHTTATVRARPTVRFPISI